jgi:hypothetical protein
MKIISNWNDHFAHLALKEREIRTAKRVFPTLTKVAIGTKTSPCITASDILNLTSETSLGFLYFTKFGGTPRMELVHHIHRPRLTEQRSGLLWGLHGLQETTGIGLETEAVHKLRAQTPPLEALRNATSAADFKALKAPAGPAVGAPLAAPAAGAGPAAAAVPAAGPAAAAATAAGHEEGPTPYKLRCTMLVPIPAFLIRAWENTTNQPPEEVAMEVNRVIADMTAHLQTQELQETTSGRDITDELGYILAYLWACANGRVHGLTTGSFASTEFHDWVSSTKNQYLQSTPAQEPRSQLVAAGQATRMEDIAMAVHAALVATGASKVTSDTKQGSGFRSLAPALQQMILLVSERHGPEIFDEDGNPLEGVVRTRPLHAYEQVLDAPHQFAAMTELRTQLFAQLGIEEAVLWPFSIVKMRMGAWTDDNNSTGGHYPTHMWAFANLSDVPTTVIAEQQLIMDEVWISVKEGNGLNDTAVKSQTKCHYVTVTNEAKASRVLEMYDAILQLLFGRMSKVITQGTAPFIKKMHARSGVLNGLQRTTTPHIYVALLWKLQFGINAYFKQCKLGIDNPRALEFALQQLEEVCDLNGTLSVNIPSDLLPTSDRTKMNHTPDGPTTKRKQVPTPTTGSDDRNTGAQKRREGEPVQNPHVSDSIKVAATTNFRAFVRAKPPQLTGIGDPCLRWLCKGSCFENCARKSSHVQLTGETKTQFERWAHATAPQASS